MCQFCFYRKNLVVSVFELGVIKFNYLIDMVVADVYFRAVIMNELAFKLRFEAEMVVLILQLLGLELKNVAFFPQFRQI